MAVTGSGSPSKDDVSDAESMVSFTGELVDWFLV